MIAIVDYKVGNFGSVKNMLKKIGREAVLTSNPQEIERASHLILPGVGRFDHGMNTLRKMDLIEPLQAAFHSGKKPILGICMGMQMMVSHSEEGDAEGLGWFKGRVQKFHFPEDRSFRVPHMGWNEVSVKKENPLFKGLEEDSSFYFVHSYAVHLDEAAGVAATTNYGIDFVSALGGGLVWGVQFHPEKSHKFGMRLLRNFIDGVSS